MISNETGIIYVHRCRFPNRSIYIIYIYDNIDLIRHPLYIYSSYRQLDHHLVIDVVKFFSTTAT